MSKNSQSPHVSGSGLPALSAQMKRLRLKFLKSVKSESLDQALETLRSNLTNEKDETARLGSLAAQTWLIRQRLLSLGSDAVPQVADYLETLEPARAKLNFAAKTAPEDQTDAKDVANTAADQAWETVKILEETVVNGMRFFKDFVVEVNAEDAQKLVKANKAEIVTKGAPETEKETKTKKTSAAESKTKKATAEDNQDTKEAPPKDEAVSDKQDKE
ncbi:hypothetical protein [Lentibacter sp.]|uniref:hypothetical protein n=1 Tax=Lentibacter sp. TaxID=2024994 RepID=UPI003F69F24F